MNINNPEEPSLLDVELVNEICDYAYEIFLQNDLEGCANYLYNSIQDFVLGDSIYYSKLQELEYWITCLHYLKQAMKFQYE